MMRRKRWQTAGEEPGGSRPVCNGNAVIIILANEGGCEGIMGCVFWKLINNYNVYKVLGGEGRPKIHPRLFLFSRIHQPQNGSFSCSHPLRSLDGSAASLITWTEVPAAAAAAVAR
jgi:hypothetical protein